MGLKYLRGILLLLALFVLAIHFATADTNYFAQGSTSASCPDPVQAITFPDLAPVALVTEVFPDLFATCTVKALNDGRNAKGVKVQFNDIRIVDLETQNTIGVRNPVNRNTAASGYARADFPLGNLPGSVEHILFTADADLSGTNQLDSAELTCWIGQRSRCTKDNHTLCLDSSGGIGNDRFEVDLSWIDPFNGAKRNAIASSQSPNSGFFFFDPLNHELLIKVLDACKNPNFESFWVFASGTTNVEFELTVTDTRAGETRQYFNQQGQNFNPITDTSAFATCP